MGKKKRRNSALTDAMIKYAEVLVLISIPVSISMINILIIETHDTKEIYDVLIVAVQKDAKNRQPTKYAKLVYRACEEITRAKYYYGFAINYFYEEEETLSLSKFAVRRDVVLY